MPLAASVRNEVYKSLEQFEWRVNHLYLDNKGNVTVGVGHLISSRTEMANIPMYSTQRKAPSNRATLAEKQAEFDNVTKQSKGYVAHWYKQHTTLIMQNLDINNQLNHHIDAFYKELIRYYTKSNGFKSDFDNFPVEAQIALFDMAYNMGLPKFKTQFINFNAAVKIEDWATASKESSRFDVKKFRNDYVKALFNSIPPSPSTP